nr:MAG TPA: hypothetical protein [Caudoviricetes sp.]
MGKILSGGLARVIYPQVFPIMYIYEKRIIW